MPNNKNIEPSELLSLYWNYYQLHAELRMKILELFITVETILFGVLAVQFGKNFYLTIIISVAISIIALVCFLLDIRSTTLLHHCRVAIRETEDKYMNSYPEKLKLFTNIKKHENLIQFSKLIRSCYIALGIAGVILAIISIVI